MEISLKVARPVAEKIYTNLSKAMPPLKPDHGEHGGCSWALHSGNPYVGRLVDRNVELRVQIPDLKIDLTEFPKTRLKQTKSGVDCLLLNIHSFVARENADVDTRVLHARTWDAVGKHIRDSSKAMLLFVPRCGLSNGEGYFMVIPPAVTPHVGMLKTDQDDLLGQILRWNDEFADNLEAAAIDKENRGKELIVMLSALDELGLATSVGKLKQLVARPQAFALDALQKVAPKTTGGGWVQGKTISGSGSATQRAVLTYATYREARVAFKLLRTAELSPQPGLSLKVQAPADWPDKLKMLYSQRVH